MLAPGMADPAQRNCLIDKLTIRLRAAGLSHSSIACYIREIRIHDSV
jgi:hypothetical protein